LLQLKESGASLVITVDCGAAAYAPLEVARDAQLDVIVLDHHAVEKAVPACAHVNPNQPGDESGLGHLCAAAVTFLFVVALNRRLRELGRYAQTGTVEPDLFAGLDLVGLATVCDVVPLVGVNRAFVRAAELRLSKLERCGIRALAAVARTEPPFSLYHCGFVFGPRINAGGRVGRASLGAELLTARSDGEAAPLAELLDRHNRERQAIESLIIEEAIGLAAMQDNSPFILVAGEGWHPGVVGIVAGRLKERFLKPAFVVGFSDGRGRASARSVMGIDIGAIVRAARDDGLLEAALARPRHRWSYDTSADIPLLAAAYAVGIACNHAFIDGNKRTAFQTMYVFLALNGLRLVAPEPAIVTLMRDVAMGAVDEVALAEWVRAHVEAR